MVGMMTGAALMLAAAAPGRDVVATVDFGAPTGRLNPALHSSGWAPRASPRSIQNDDAAVRSLGMAYARTHDWALVNEGQRVVDYQYVFPLIDKDATDPSNYCFAPTDHLLSLARDVGLKIFYRLGTSIEHTGDVHFNARIPDDFDKVAEVFAATVRHYNRGWAGGKEWGIEYWEIWNEPDGITNMWCPDPDDLARLGGANDPRAWAFARERFVEFFVTCLKRIKREFPEVKVGGPALCWADCSYFRQILERCRKEGVAPDFLSFHYYGQNPSDMTRGAAEVRRLCDEMGFKKCEVILNEWHYILTWDGIHGRNSTPAMVRRALDGPTGHNNIDSACFTLSSLIAFQTSALDQAYYYGCAHQGNWGYMDVYKQFNKNYYACRLFGDVVKTCDTLCRAETDGGTVSVLAAKSADGKRGVLLASDYRGSGQVLRFKVAGAGRVAGVTLLDHTHDALPHDFDWRDGLLTVVKPDKNSAAFLVEFEWP